MQATHISNDITIKNAKASNANANVCHNINAKLNNTNTNNITGVSVNKR